MTDNKKDSDKNKIDPDIVKTAETNNKKFEKERSAKGLGKLNNDSDELIGIKLDLDDKKLDIDSTRESIRIIADSANKNFQANLEGMGAEMLARLRSNSLLDTPVDDSINVAAKDKTKKEESSKKAKDLITELNSLDSNTVNDLLYIESARLSGYDFFRQISAYIPICSEACDVYTDTIMCPDDTNRKKLIKEYTDKNADIKVTSLVAERLDELEVKYSANVLIEEVIKESLRDGDAFIAVLNVRQELAKEFYAKENNKILSETVDSFIFKESSEYIIPYLSTRELIRDQIYSTSFLKEALLLEEDSSNKIDENQSNDFHFLEEFNKDVTDYLNKMVTIIPKDRVNLSTQLGLKAFEKNLENSNFPISKDKLSTETSEAIKTYNKYGINKIDTRKSSNIAVSDADKKKSIKEIEKKLDNIYGSIVKKFNPENVIKLYVDTTVFGYLCFETPYGGIIDFGRQLSVNSNKRLVTSIDNAISNYSASMTGNTQTDSGIMNVKNKVIYDTIVKTLAKQLDMAFLADNPKFAHDTLRVLSLNRNKGKKILISFIPSDQMVHFTPEVATGYGESIYNKGKLFAKLYIGAMIAAFLRNAIRKPERLVIWVNTGLDHDAENSIQATIRSIKQKEIKFNNLNDITTTMRSIGEFRDFYIPVTDDRKPIEFDNITQGGNIGEVDTPYLEFLRKQLIITTGLPGSFLGYSEDVQFARSLATDNGRVLRRVLKFQNSYTLASTKLFRLLYRNEYLSLEEIYNTETNAAKIIKNSGVNVNKINVTLPTPIGMFLSNINDSIGQVGTVLDFLTDNIMLAGSDDDVLKMCLKRLLARKFLPQLPWADIDQIIIQAKKDAIVEKIRAGKDQSTDGGMGGGFGGAPPPDTDDGDQPSDESGDNETQPDDTEDSQNPDDSGDGYMDSDALLGDDKEQDQ